MIMGSVGLETKDHCAGEDQQQFSSQLVRPTEQYTERPTSPLFEEVALLLNTYMSR
jgi:hypothetical protein